MRSTPARTAGVGFVAGLVLMCLPATGSAFDEDLFDPRFVFEVLDPGICGMPPAHLTDAEILPLIDRDGAPVSGRLTGPIAGDIFADGAFNPDEDGIVATIAGVMITPEDRVMGVCVAIVPIGETEVAEGTVDLYGPEPSGVSAPAYLAVAQVLERGGNNEEVIVGNLVGGSGTVTFDRDMSESLNGRLEIDGRIDGVSGADNDMTLALAFDDLLPELSNALRLRAGD